MESSGVAENTLWIEKRRKTIAIDLRAPWLAASVAVELLKSVPKKKRDFILDKLYN
jgi:hypothetical protein